MAVRDKLAPTLHDHEVDGHAVIALGLKELGISHVYGVGGIPVHETLSACARNGIRVIGVRHQQAAGLMAAVHNYIEGRVSAVALVSSGPAITNLATAILVARDNGWPLVALGARRSEMLHEMGGFQSLDAVPIFQSITKFSEAVNSASAIVPALTKAVETAANGRPGPVYLDLVEEILGQKEVASRRAQPLPPAPRQFDEDAIRRAIELLTQAKRPAILIGEAVRWSEPYDELNQLVDRLDAPFAASPMGRGYLPDDHPGCYDDARSYLLSTADAVLLIGARLDWTFRFGAEIARNAKLVQIAIHESEIGANITPEVAIAGDIKQILRRLLREIDHAQKQREPAAPDFFWRAHLDRKRDETAGKWNMLALESEPISPLRLVAELRDFIPRDAICVIDGNVILAAAQHLLPSYLPASRLTPGNNGCMGVGVPFGIAAKLALPGRMVLTISGDFAFGLSAMEMETAVRFRVPVIIVVANNDGNAGAVNQRAYYAADYPDRVTMFAPDIHYDQMMRAFGGHGEYVDRAEQIKPALARAAASGRPACINVRVNPDSPYPR